MALEPISSCGPGNDHFAHTGRALQGHTELKAPPYDEASRLAGQGTSHRKGGDSVVGGLRQCKTE